MFVIKDCEKCGKDYMYHSSDLGRYNKLCQECYEKEKKGDKNLQS